MFSGMFFCIRKSGKNITYIRTNRNLLLIRDVNNFEGAVYGCDRCSAQYYCKKERSEECEPMAESFKRKGIPEDKVCLYVLGKICICSECGYLPDYVVERLEEISEYSCNHMG